MGTLTSGTATLRSAYRAPEGRSLFLKRSSQLHHFIRRGHSNGRLRCAAARPLEGLVKAIASKQPDPSRMFTSLPGPGLVSSRKGSHIAHLSTSDGRIMAGGEQVAFRGVNWPGFETSDWSFLQGLWTDDNLTNDIRTVAWRIRLLGFNTIRIPFSFKILEKPLSTARSAHYTFPQDPASDDRVAKSVIPGNKYTTLAANGAPLPRPKPLTMFYGRPRNGQQGTANSSSIPTQASGDVWIRERFIWVVRYLIDNDFYVIIDDHINKDGAGSSMDPTVMQDASRWAQKWKDLVFDIVTRDDGPGDNIYKQRLVVDLINEPDSNRLNWEGLKDTYLQAIRKILEVSPTTLMLIEGCGQTGYVQNWGDGFVTDTSIIYAQHHPAMSNPNEFFRALHDERFLDNIVLSPHVYPPSVADPGYQGFHSKKFDDANMRPRWVASFGVLANGNASSPLPGHKFPIIIGEIGSFLDKDKNNVDISGIDPPVIRSLFIWLRSMVPAHAGASYYPHVIWWAWTGSGDTGGLIQDLHPDEVVWEKIHLLESTDSSQGIDLKPWYTTI